MTADIVILIHFSFILFVIFGGFLVMKWPKFIWLHIPAMIWGILIEFYGWICPLTILENDLRRTEDGGVYTGGFIEYYLLPVIYPAGLTREIQIIMGFAVIIINLLVYFLIFKKTERRNKHG